MNFMEEVNEETQAMLKQISIRKAEKKAFVDEYCPRCDCILRYDEGDICCSCQELKDQEED